MSRILGQDKIEIRNLKTTVSFEKTGGGNWEVWNRFISIAGKRVYEIGNICGTCKFYFERLDGANQSINVNVDEVVEKLNNGFETLESEITQSISQVIPNGKYRVILLKVFPKLIELGKEQDYFLKEQVELWGIDGFWGLPHHPKVSYYRGNDQPIKETEKVFEFFIPIFPQTWLEEERIEKYKQEILKGSTPTAIALSVLDIKSPAVWIDDKQPEFTSHWCLAHYILDGHHKMYAASLVNKPIHLLAFLAIEESIVETESDIDTLLQNI